MNHFNHSWTAIALLGLLLFSPVINAIELAQRHDPTNAYRQIDYQHLSFTDYLSNIRDLISTNNPKANAKTIEGISVLEAVMPFEWQPDVSCMLKPNKQKKGVLLIHGLSDSPYLMRDIGRHFLKNCYLVRSILLPGHATVPGDLQEVEVEDWVEATHFGINSFNGLVDQLVIVGFSTGGALALDYVINETSQKSVDTLVLLSPALRINSNFAFAASWLNRLGGLFSKLKWTDIADDDDFSKYESFALNGGAQIYELGQKLGRLDDSSKPVSIPMYIAAAVEDTTIDTKATKTFFESRANNKSQLRLFSGAKNQNQNRQVLSQSHLSIPTSPLNKHYGVTGDYSSCGHYFDDEKKYRACKDLPPETVFFGERTEENLKYFPLRRMTWNPEFKSMLAEIDTFLEQNLNQ